MLFAVLKSAAFFVQVTNAKQIIASANLTTLLLSMTSVVNRRKSLATISEIKINTKQPKTDCRI
jgi:hypothetical protein